MTGLPNRISWGLLTFFFGFVSWMTFAADQDGNDSARTKLTGYIESLSALDPGNLDSVQEGLRQFGALFDNESVEDRDVAFLAFRQFYYEVEREQLGDERFDEEEFDDALLKTLQRNGFRLGNTQGYRYADENPYFLYREFDKRVSEPIRELLRVRAKELKEGLTEDAALLISFENVADRLRTWDRYLDKYPDSPLLDEVEYFYRAYLYTLLRGPDNSPVFDYFRDEEDDVARVGPEIREIYRKYVRDHGGTRSGETLKEYLFILEREEFSRSAEVESFIRKLRDFLQSVPKPDSW